MTSHSVALSLSTDSNHSLSSTSDILVVVLRGGGVGPEDTEVSCLAVSIGVYVGLVGAVLAGQTLIAVVNTPPEGVVPVGSGRAGVLCRVLGGNGTVVAL